jgi:cellulose biosynthesis protein BcsQ
VVSAKRTHNLNIEAYYFGLLQDKFQGKLFNTVISHSVQIPEARAMLQSIVSYAPNSVQARQYQSVADEYLARVEAK